MKKIVLFISLFLMISLWIGQAQVTIGSVSNPAAGALLDLKERNITAGDTTSSTRGMIFPRVRLTDIGELYPMYSSSDNAYVTNRVALKAKHIGMTVYNTNGTNGFTQGLHVWNGKNWIKPVTELPSTTQTSFNLLNMVGGNLSVASGDSSNGANGDGGSILPFGNNTSGTDRYITIPENGSYVFNLRLYGTHGRGAAIYYLSLWANGTVDGSGRFATLRDATLKDIAEIDISVNGTPVRSFASYSISLGAYFNAGDRVRLKIAYNQGHTLNIAPWVLVSQSASTSASRTSLIWRKL